MPTAGIASRAARIADLPAAPVLALLELVPADPEALASLQIRPAGKEGLAQLEVASPVLMGRLEVEGDCSRPVSLPRGALAVIRRRHSDAERLVVDAVAEPGMVGLRSFGKDATVAISCPEAQPLPELPLVPLPEAPRPAAGAPLPLLLDPVLLSRAIGVLHRLDCRPIRLELLGDPLVGAALAIYPAPGGDLSGALQLARCLPPEAR
jgi:hypothetical protein